MSDETPEARRDAAIAQVIAAGGVVTGTTALADPAEPATTVAYRLTVTVPRRSVAAAVEAVRAATQTDLTGLVATEEEAEDAAGSGE